MTKKQRLKQIADELAPVMRSRLFAEAAAKVVHDHYPKIMKALAEADAAERLRPLAPP